MQQQPIPVHRQYAGDSAETRMWNRNSLARRLLAVGTEESALAWARAVLNGARTATAPCDAAQGSDESDRVALLPR